MVFRLLLLTGLFFGCFAAPAGLAQAQQTAPSVLVQLDTSEGAIVVELDAAHAPITVENFLTYVKEGYYKGTVFHRVIDGFMIQGGGFDQSMKKKKTHREIRNEAGNGLKNDKYTIAMARTDQPHSATSQFFINTIDNGFRLDRGTPGNPHGYTVFGKVVKGQEIVDRIGKAATKPIPDPMVPGRLMSDVPVTQIVIKDAKVVAAE